MGNVFKQADFYLKVWILPADVSEIQKIWLPLNSDNKKLNVSESKAEFLGAKMSIVKSVFMKHNLH